MTPHRAATLSAVHSTLALLAAVAAVVVGFESAEPGSYGPDASLRTPAVVVQVTAVIYLSLTAIVQFLWARRMRRESLPLPKKLWLLMSHVWVLLVAGSVIARGPVARAYLVGFDHSIATLAVLSVLCVAAVLISWCCQGNAQAATLDDSAMPAAAALDRSTWLQFLSAVLLVLSLWWLESRL